jgi:hypothetical protein
MATVSSLLIMAAAVGVATPQPNPVVAQADAPQSTETAKTERKICRTSLRIGSRISKTRSCLTKAEWDEIEAETGSTIRDEQREAQSNPTNG